MAINKFKSVAKFQSNGSSLTVKATEGKTGITVAVSLREPGIKKLQTGLTSRFDWASSRSITADQAVKDSATLKFNELVAEAKKNGWSERVKKIKVAKVQAFTTMPVAPVEKPKAPDAPKVDAPKAGKGKK
jgi:hypothetical protein